MVFNLGCNCCLRRRPEVDYCSNCENTAVLSKQFGAQAPSQNRPYMLSALDIKSGHTDVAWIHSSEMTDDDLHGDLLAIARA